MGNVSARDLAETYLPAFKACAAAGAQQVMCSYNAVNGVPTCLDQHAQNGILRESFGFDGMIVSDCDAIADAWEPNDHNYASNASDATAKGILAGCDMDCGPTYQSGAAQAVSSGALPRSALNKAVARSLAMRFRLGEFDERVPYRNSEVYGADALDSKSARAAALRAAEESIVLLQNRVNSKNNAPLLPLDVPASGLRVGVVGPLADPRWAPDDKNDYCPSYKVSPLAGLQASAETIKNLHVETCHDCCAEQKTHDSPAKCNVARTAAFAKQVDVVILCLGGDLGGEGRDWAATLPADQAALATAVVKQNTRSVAVLVHGNPMAIDTLARSFDAIVETFECGQSAGTALAKMLLGTSEVAPSGVLPWTVYPDNYTSSVRMSDMAMRAGPGRTYRFFKGTPTFPFGHGLTYTQFSLEWAGTPAQKQTIASIKAGLHFKLKVTNAGARPGAKVIAAFVHIDSKAAPDGPLKQLFGLEKVVLQPRASATVTIDSNSIPGFCSFCSVDDAGESKVRPGTLTITIGTGGHDAPSALLTHKVEVV